jgi:uncharacterized membrane protein YcaP (DUF421 family)
MDSVLRIAVIYGFLMLLFRVGGRRTLGDLSRFDLVVLLIISELVQQAVVADDASLTNAMILCSSLVAFDVALSWLKLRYRRLDEMLEGTPLLVVDRGKPLFEPMRQMRIDTAEVLAAARLAHGIARMEQIRYAVVETSGAISIVPEPGVAADERPA